MLEAYVRSTMSLKEVQETLKVGKTRFFALVKEYRRDRQRFSISYERESPGRLGQAAEAQVKHELLREKSLVDDPRLPIRHYNYSAVRDRLKKNSVLVSVPTIIRRAKDLDCYIPHRRKSEPHTREVATTSVGALVQHDASLPSLPQSTKQSANFQFAALSVQSGI
jgi:transposase